MDISADLAGAQAANKVLTENVLRLQRENDQLRDELDALRDSKGKVESDTSISDSGIVSSRYMTHNTF